MANPLLSICIPTDGNSKWLIPTLRGIYAQNIDISLFEVIITDNGQNSSILSDLAPYRYDNLHYIKTNDIGFLNLVTSLKSGNGILRKMLNHRSIIIPGTIERWLHIAKQYEVSKPMLFFTDFQMKKGTCIECHGLDFFLSNLSYWSSWSAGLSIWDIDVDKLDVIELNSMFPNASILFNLRENTDYVICDEKYQEMQDETGKGGYDLFHTFAVEYLDILSELRIHKRISEKTFIFIKRDLLKFLANWFCVLIYHKDEYTFMNRNIKQSILIYYSKWDYMYFYLSSYLILPISRLIQFMKR